MSDTATIFLGTGRRKNATASVRLAPGTGVWSLNGREPKAYFGSAALVAYSEQPLVLTETRGKFDVVARLEGGGIAGQSGALRHALARALIKADATLRGALKKQGCLMRDPRMKERKKPGQPGARKRFQFSKR